MNIFRFLSRTFPVKSHAIYGILIFMMIGCQAPAPPVRDNYDFALQHVNDLRLSTYFTAHTIDRLLSSEEGKREALSLMRANGITKVYIEVYRSGLVVDPALLGEVAEYFITNGFEVVGGIATVPGGDFGVKQEGQLGWFNWQNPKTQNDLKQVMLDAAPIFDTFIVDDFLCTGDTSLESKAAKGAQSWSVYRRKLLTDLATSIFIEPAKSVNPDIHMIIKYPQWYDRFHMFGYDVESGPRLFDEVWVGTETRGQYTQRFGFVQPYEGFVNYRWIASLSGDKIGGAWFDHGDCDQLDFIEQAYQSVLAGAPELVIFNYGSFVNGHPGHHLLRMDLEKLFALAKTVKASPIIGIPGFKPPHSDAGGDLYIMDFIGMLGIPLIPVSSYPENAKTIFLPTQAASDPEIVDRIASSLQQGSRVIMTAGFLAKVQDGGKLADLAGISMPVVQSLSADKVLVDGIEKLLSGQFDLEASFQVLEAEAVLEAKADNTLIPFLTKSANGQIYVVNAHTFSEADFEAVGEVLLCPRRLGLVELPQSWANSIRDVFNEHLGIDIDAPTRVTMQPIENGQVVLHNYNQHEVELKLNGLKDAASIDLFTNRDIDIHAGEMHIKMPPRSRLWINN
jgi:hypothetical protein